MCLILCHSHYIIPFSKLFDNVISCLILFHIVPNFCNPSPVELFISHATMLFDGIISNCVINSTFSHTSTFGRSSVKLQS